MLVLTSLIEFAHNHTGHDWGQTHGSFSLMVVSCLLRCTCLMHLETVCSYISYCSSERTDQQYKMENKQLKGDIKNGLKANVGDKKWSRELDSFCGLPVSLAPCWDDRCADDVIRKGIGREGGAIRAREESVRAEPPSERRKDWKREQDCGYPSLPHSHAIIQFSQDVSLSQFCFIFPKWTTRAT